MDACMAGWNFDDVLGGAICLVILVWFLFHAGET